MSRKLIVVGIFLLISEVNAGGVWFNVNMNCKVNPGLATCTMSNTGTIPMYCELQADGAFANGNSLNAFLNVWIPPGQYRYVYVNTAPPNPPFVNAFGGGQCHY